MKSTSRKFPNKSAYFADPFPLVFILFRSRFFYYLLFTRQTEAGKKFGNSFRNMKDKRGIFSSFFYNIRSSIIKLCAYNFRRNRAVRTLYFCDFYLQLDLLFFIKFFVLFTHRFSSITNFLPHFFT